MFRKPPENPLSGSESFREFLRCSRLIQVAPRIEHAVDLGAVLGPHLDLVAITVVRDQRLVSLFVRPIAHDSEGGHRSRTRMF
jgi:hypothetical protein